MYHQIPLHLKHLTNEILPPLLKCQWIYSLPVQRLDIFISDGYFTIPRNTCSQMWLHIGTTWVV